jgi:outer membrane biosynthesis protein TonB
VSENRAPALIGSVILHAVVIGAGLVTLPLWSKPIEMVASTPITIVSHAPPEAPSAPVESPTPTPETTPEPSPEPQPAPPPPAPAPVPKPTPTPPPKPMPAPAPRPIPKPAPAPTPTPPKKVESKPLDLNALANSLPQAKPNKNARPTAKPFDLAALTSTLPRSAGARGAPKSATGPVVNPGPVRPLSGDEMGAVTAKLMRLWHPNCGAEGVGKVVVRVEMHLTADGRLARQPELLDRPIVDAAGPVAQVSAQRALAAVVQGEPYAELPRDRYPAWKDITVRFDAKQACGG